MGDQYYTEVYVEDSILTVTVKDNYTQLTYVFILDGEKMRWKGTYEFNHDYVDIRTCPAEIWEIAKDIINRAQEPY